MLCLLSFAVLCICFAGSSSCTATHQCKKPALRKEWRALGHGGQKDFTDAIKCMSYLPHDTGLSPTGATPGLPPILSNSSLYDDLVYTHMDALNSVHFTGRFLPWHRLYLHTMEALLKDKCGYKGHIPYWDWTIDAHDVKRSPIFGADPWVGFGTFPNASTNFTLSDGAFRDIIRVYPVPHRLQRNYTLRPWETQFFPWTFNMPNKEGNATQTTAEYIKLTTGFIGNFTAFQSYMDGSHLEGMHPAAHITLGGDVSNLSWSPNDPIFFLLHGQLDRAWAAWQALDPRNRNVVAGGLDQDLNDFPAHPTGTGSPVTKNTVLYMAGLGPDAKVKDVLSTTGGHLCYQYAT